MNQKFPNYIDAKSRPADRCCKAAFLWGGGSVDEVALLLELFDEFAELFGEAVHGALEAGQQVERHDDGEADARDCGQEVLFHAGHLLAGDGKGRRVLRRVLRPRPCGWSRPCRRWGRRRPSSGLSWR